MRALLTALLLTGLATTYAQTLDWWEVGPHEMSNTYWDDYGCWQHVIFNPRSQDEFGLSLVRVNWDTSVDIQVTILNEQL